LNSLNKNQAKAPAKKKKAHVTLNILTFLLIEQPRSFLHFVYEPLCLKDNRI
jgi:hypothetical protein